MTYRDETTLPYDRCRILVVVPCLNEAEHIEAVLTGLLAGQDKVDLRVVVADGGSTDGTREIVKAIRDRDNHVLLLDNPSKIQSAGVNEAVRKFGNGARYLIRVDAHAAYPDRFCERLVAEQASTGADSIVVTLQTKGISCFQRAAAAAQNSILGNGGSSHRNATGGRWVDHGHHALMTLDAYRAVGGYDENFPYNEDAELDARLSKAGFRIYLTPEAPITYYPRRSPSALFRQYFNFGRGRAKNFLKHRGNIKLRHLALLAVAPAICLLVLAPNVPILGLPALAWSFLCVGYGLLLGLRVRDTCAAASGIAAAAAQAGWSFGFLIELAVALVRGAVRWSTKRYSALRHPDQIAP